MAEPRILLSGYFGFGNFGDDAILYCMMEQFQKMRPDVSLSVLTQNLEHEKQWYRQGVTLYDRNNPMQLFQAERECDIFISGGGGLFQDTTSIKSVFYYSGQVFLALNLRKKVVVFSQGLGPLHSAASKQLVAAILKQVHAASFRDEGSRELAHSLTGKNFELAADPVFLLDESEFPFSQCPDAPLYAFLENPVWKTRVGVSLRSWNYSAFFHHFISFLKSITGNDVALVFVPFHMPEDGRVCHDMQKEFPKQAIRLPMLYPPPLTFQHIMRYTDVFLCMRYHSAVCAFLAGKPALGFSYDPKVRALFSDFGLSEFCLSLDASQQDMLSCYEKLMQEKDSVVSRIQAHLPVMKERALKSFTLALEMV